MILNALVIGAGRKSILKTLKGLKDFTWLRAPQIKRLGDALIVTKVERRETIVDDRMAAESLYVLLSGVARVTCRNRKGERPLVNILLPGIIPIFPPLVTGVAYAFRCEAISDCQIGTIELNRFTDICLGVKWPGFRRLALSCVGRWDLIELRCANLMSYSLVERLAITLMEMAETFGVRDFQGTRLTISLRHRDLAELLGASRSRVTEFMKEFSRLGMIEGTARGLILKTERLEKFLSRPARAVSLPTQSSP